MRVFLTACFVWTTTLAGAWGAPCQEGRELDVCKLRIGHLECRKQLSEQRLAVLERKVGHGTEEQQRRIPAARAKFQRDLEDADSKLLIVKDQGALPGCAKSLARGSSVLRMEGDVEFCRITSGGERDCRKAEQGQVLQHGESIRTGKDGRVELIYGDATRIYLRPLTTYTFSENGVGLLTKGKLVFGRVAGAMMNITKPRHGTRHSPGEAVSAVRAQVPPELMIRTPTTVAAVRGTKFGLSVGDDAIAHLTPEEGIVEWTMTGKPPAAGGWWGPLRPSESPSESGWVVLRASEGTATLGVEGERTVQVGAKLVKGQKLKVGGEGATLGLGRGAWAALKAGSLLELPSSGETIANLLKGALYFHSDGNGGPLNLATPGFFLCKVKEGALEITLGPDGGPDLVLREGGVFVEAVHIELPR